MNIPSNFSLEETLKFYELPAELQRKLDEHFKEVDRLQKELTSARRDYEILHAQDFFKYDLLEKIQQICEHETKGKDIKAAIALAFENSYVEM